MLKNGIKVINKKGLNYIVEDRGRVLKSNPWLGQDKSCIEIPKASRGPEDLQDPQNSLRVHLPSGKPYKQPQVAPD